MIACMLDPVAAVPDSGTYMHNMHTPVVMPQDQHHLQDFSTSASPLNN